MLNKNIDDLTEIAVKALVEVAQDSNAPAAARAAASRTLLETVGRIGRLQTNVGEGSKALAEMSARDLEMEIDRLKRLQTDVKPEFDPFSDIA